MELSHHGERREGSSHYQHTQETGFIFYTTYSLFMGALHSWHIMIMNGVWLHRERRAVTRKGCFWTFFFSFYPEPWWVLLRGIQGGERGITGHTEYNCDLLELGPGPGQNSEQFYNQFVSCWPKLHTDTVRGGARVLPWTNATKKGWCNYSMFCSFLQAWQERYVNHDVNQNCDCKKEE